MRREMKSRMMKMKHGGQEDIQCCPLSGAAKAISMIDGAVMLVIGTEECTYYTKSTLDVKSMGDSCFSVVLDKNDVTFGSVEKVTWAVEELLFEYNPKSLFLVTTCVVEVIGDDFSALAKETTKKYKIPVEVIQTNHFKGKDAEYGFNLVEQKIQDLQISMGFVSSLKKLQMCTCHSEPKAKNLKDEHKLFLYKIKRKVGGRR